MIKLFRTDVKGGCVESWFDTNLCCWITTMKEQSGSMPELHYNPTKKGAKATHAMLVKNAKIVVEPS